MKIDYTKLNKDYCKFPVNDIDDIIYEDFIYLFWELNLSKTIVSQILGCSLGVINKYIINNKIFKTPQMIQESFKNTINFKYSTDNIAKTDLSKQKYKQTCIEKYGVDNTFKDETFKQKSKQTIKQKYGVDNISQNQQIKQQKMETIINNYGVDNPMKVKEIVLKNFETKKKNGSYGKSKDEEYIFNCLLQKYKNVKRQYFCEKYPFHCDFYIPEQDLFIEYQGFVSHGKHAYNPNNTEDQQTLENWWQKVYDTAQLLENNKLKDNAYLNFIHTWTITDPKKRQIVKENNLNWIEFFNLQEFEDWYNKEI